MKFIPGKKEKKGFALFVAITIAGVLVFVSFIISNIALKETNFSIAAKESQKAFYNAQSGIDCLHYWDTRYNPTPNAITPGEESAFDTAGDTSIIYCGTSSHQVTPQEETINGYNKIVTVVSKVQLGSTPLKGCVDLRVERDVRDSPSDFIGKVRYEALGYNKCDGNNRIQRGIDESITIFFD